MATVTYIPESKQSISAMKGLIDYCCQECKTLDKASGDYLIGGINVNGKKAYREFMITKNSYRKTDGMNFYQYVQSFSPNENVTAEQVHKIGLEFAEKAWHGHEVLVTTHTDAEHLHNHFVINSVNFNDGSKLRQNPKTLKSLRDMSDRICIEHGLSVLKPYEKDGAKLSSREYRAASNGESWKFKLISDIDFVMNRSGSREDFIREMNMLGYQITWTDERKYITFTCPNGMKCRDIRLHDEKYLKGVLEYEFTIRKKHTAEQRKRESKLLEDAVEFQPKLYQLIERLATRKELTDHCTEIQNIKADYMENTVQEVVTANMNTVEKMQAIVEQAGKTQEQFISDCSKALSESTEMLNSLVEKLQQKIMKIITATAVSSAALSVLACAVFWKLAA